jgi:predicted RNase H-like nuclease (RuvC/YqgF family)
MIESTKKSNYSKKELVKMIKEALEKGPRCSQLNYAMSQYTLKSVCQGFEAFQQEVQSKIEEQAGKTDEKTRYQPINKLDEGINRVLETIVGSKQRKGQKQSHRIKQAECVLQKELEDLEGKIQSIQHENKNIKEKIYQLRYLITAYVRYNPKASKAENEKDRGHLTKLYEQGGVKSIKSYLLSEACKIDYIRNNQ